MKTIAAVVAAGSIAVIGGGQLVARYVGAPASGPGASSSAKVGRECWSPNKIKNSSFSHRGIPGGIRSFELDAVQGCVFNVKIEIASPAGVRTLDYDAQYSAGDRPIFLRYNVPP